MKRNKRVWPVITLLVVLAVILPTGAAEAQMRLFSRGVSGFSGALDVGGENGGAWGRFTSWLSILASG